MVDFDPEDSNIPQKLRSRFTSWSTNVPRLQYSQYGPINKYLSLKFPDAMVKPQGLIRPGMPEEKKGMVDEEVTAKNEGLDGDDEVDVGNSSLLSIDSTGQFVSKQSQKLYPDFIVASYYEEEEKHDQIRLIVEIGSLHKREASRTVKEEIQKQLYDYMSLLGSEGARWSTTALGVALLGTEVCFCRPRRNRDGSTTFSLHGKWYDLYDGTFVKEINRVARVCKENDD